MRGDERLAFPKDGFGAQIISEFAIQPWRSGATILSVRDIWGLRAPVISTPAEPRHALNLDHGNDAG
jgi:hypothetical protein